MPEITIKTIIDGEPAVRVIGAVTKNGLAIHRTISSADHWTLTHENTGIAIHSRFYLRGQAVAARNGLIELFGGDAPDELEPSAEIRRIVKAAKE